MAHQIGGEATARPRHPARCRMSRHGWISPTSCSSIRRAPAIRAPLAPTKRHAAGCGRSRAILPIRGDDPPLARQKRARRLAKIHPRRELRRVPCAAPCTRTCRQPRHRGGRPEHWCRRRSNSAGQHAFDPFRMGLAPALHDGGITRRTRTALHALKSCRCGTGTHGTDYLLDLAYAEDAMLAAVALLCRSALHRSPGSILPLVRPLPRSASTTTCSCTNLNRAREPVSAVHTTPRSLAGRSVSARRAELTMPDPVLEGYEGARQRRDGLYLLLGRLRWYPDNLVPARRTTRRPPAMAVGWGLRACRSLVVLR